MQIRSNAFVEYSFPQCPKAKWDGEQSPPLRKEGGYDRPYISFLSVLYIACKLFLMTVFSSRVCVCIG